MSGFTIPDFAVPAGEIPRWAQKVSPYAAEEFPAPKPEDAVAAPSSAPPPAPPGVPQWAAEMDRLLSPGKSANALVQGASTLVSPLQSLVAKTFSGVRRLTGDKTPVDVMDAQEMRAMSEPRERAAREAPLAFMAGGVGSMLLGNVLTGGALAPYSAAAPTTAGVAPALTRAGASVADASLFNAASAAGTGGDPVAAATSPANLVAALPHGPEIVREGAGGAARSLVPQSVKDWMARNAQTEAFKAAAAGRSNSVAGKMDELQPGRSSDVGQFLLDKGLLPSNRTQPAEILTGARAAKRAAGAEMGAAKTQADTNPQAFLPWQDFLANDVQPVLSRLRKFQNAAADALEAKFAEFNQGLGGRSFISPSEAHDLRQQMDVFARTNRGQADPARTVPTEEMNRLRGSFDARMGAGMNAAGLGDEWSAANRDYGLAKDAIKAATAGTRDLMNRRVGFSEQVGGIIPGVVAGLAGGAPHGPGMALTLGGLAGAGGAVVQHGLRKFGSATAARGLGNFADFLRSGAPPTSPPTLATTGFTVAPAMALSAGSAKEGVPVPSPAFGTLTPDGQNRKDLEAQGVPAPPARPVTDEIQAILNTNPAAAGRYAPDLQSALSKDPVNRQALSERHFVLWLSDPNYRATLSRALAPAGGVRP